MCRLLAGGIVTEVVVLIVRRWKRSREQEEG
jgi:hypothetical protein